MKKYLEIFCREAGEHLGSLQSGLLLLEKDPARSGLLHELLRNAHTLKGSARMVGLSEISAITHTMEELLKGMEQGSLSVDAAGIDLLLKGTDAVALITSALAKGERPPLDLERFVADYQRGEVPRPLPQGSREGSGGESGETVRASVKTLDLLVNLTGEMIISKKRLESKLARLREIAEQCEPTGAALLRDFGRDLEEDLLHLDQQVQELKEKGMALRMLPLRSVTDGLDRVVRDLGRRLGKEARLETIGGGIEMDRILLEGLKPVLIHLLTNALCHGIEDPEQRAAAGKNREGSVRITARHEGNSVRVEVRDDGRGMDPGRIREAAVARALVERSEAEALSDDEALQLTFRAGFSTAGEVTDLAGRGVGMDVVKKNVEQLKGSITLESEVGSFCEISLRLPLTLSVLEALLVRCGGETLAIPLDYVQEIMRVQPADTVTLGSRESVRVRGTTTPICSLGALLGLPEQTEGTGAAGAAALVLKLDQQRIACTVDAHLGSSEVVVKGLGKQFGKVRFVFGATIMEDGNPALILNVPDLFEASAAGALPPPCCPAPSSGKGGRSVLVVDDSITTRTMEQSILSTHGYRVETAVSGEDALEKARLASFDLVITDVEMPGIDGFELTCTLGRSEGYRETPVIVVSSLSRDEDKRRALESGAQAYIVKGAFDQGMLLETVQTLIG